jgi:hypothetical protein
MLRRAGLAAIAAPMLALAIAGCATTRTSAVRSAERLDQNSRTLAQDARSQSDRGVSSSSDLAHDSRLLARRAREFRRTLQRSGSTSDPAVRHAFDKVARTYHRVRRDVQNSGDSQERRDLRPVTRAYLDTEDRMGGYPPDHRNADSDGDGS